jgi:hypothetical protein
MSVTMSRPLTVVKWTLAEINTFHKFRNAIVINLGAAYQLKMFLKHCELYVGPSIVISHPNSEIRNHVGINYFKFQNQGCGAN